jgi:hypothetical protein
VFRMRILDWSVVRFEPSRVAVPREPPIHPSVFLKASRIASRSTSCRLSLQSVSLKARPVRKDLSSSSGTLRHSLAAIVGSTGALGTIEFEPGLQHDLPTILDKLIPPDRNYDHEQTWHDGNGTRICRPPFSDHH